MTSHRVIDRPWLQTTSGIDGEISRVSLLGSQGELPWRLGEERLTITAPEVEADGLAVVFEIEF